MLKEFTYDGYTSLLQTAMRYDFNFLGFQDIINAPSGKFCLLRHDVDADLEVAVKMAEIEASMGVKSTFFLMLRSPVYNLFGRNNHRFVERIITLGHFIGLHYDEGFYPGNKKSLEELVDVEANIIEGMFNCRINAVSFHQPGERIIANEVSLHRLISTYDKKKLEGITYLSDSNMIWKGGDPWTFFSNPSSAKLQLLIHPMWWVGNGKQNTEELWDKAILANSMRSFDQIIQTERAFGAPRRLGFVK